MAILKVDTITSADTPTVSITDGASISGVTTFSSDINIADKIVHTGDTNTAIRFPAADTITAETGGSERLRIDSNGMIGIGGITPKTQNTFAAIEIGAGGLIGGQTSAKTTEMVTNAYYNSGWKYTHGSLEASQYYQYQGAHHWTTAGSGSADGAITFSERLKITNAGQTQVTGSMKVQNAGNVSFNIRDTTGTAVSNWLEVKTSGAAEYNCYKEGVGTAYPHVFKGYTTEYARIDAAGIKFNGDTATANGLDDYEEGSWTPVPARYTGGNANLSMSTQNGKYTKIGNMVRLEFYIVISSVTSQGSSLTQLRGLPFLPNASYQNTGVCFYNDGFQHDNDQDYTIITTVHQDNSGVVYFKSNGCDAGNGLATKDFIAGTITGSCTYLTDS